MISGVRLGHLPGQSNQLQQVVNVLRSREVRMGPNRGDAGHPAVEVSCGSKNGSVRARAARRFYPQEPTSSACPGMSGWCQFPPPARPPGHSPEEGSARASALRHPLRVALMLVALGDRTGRVPGSLDALDLLADLARGRAERVDADLAVRHAGAQRAELGCGIVLRQAEVERLVFQLGEIRRDLGSRIAPARLVLVGGGAQRPKADLGIGEARADMGKILRGVALALAQLGGLRLDLGELCRQGSDAVL